MLRHIHDPGWAGIADDLASRFGTGPLSRASAGSNVVLIGEREVIKLIAPCWIGEFGREVRGLAAVSGRLPVETPELIGAELVDGWGLIRMRRLGGLHAEAVWPGLDAAGRLRLAAQIGELIAALRRVPSTALAALPEERPWAELERAWRAELPGLLASCGEPEPLIAEVRALLARYPYEDPRGAALTHMDLTDDNLLVSPDGAGGWRLSGVLDFADARAGAGWAEIASPVVFLTGGDPALTQALLSSAGLAGSREAEPEALSLACHLHPFAGAFWRRICQARRGAA